MDEMDEIDEIDEQRRTFKLFVCNGHYGTHFNMGTLIFSMSSLVRVKPYFYNV